MADESVSVMLHIVHFKIGSSTRKSAFDLYIFHVPVIYCKYQEHEKVEKLKHYIFTVSSGLTISSSGVLGFAMVYI